MLKETDTILIINNSRCALIYKFATEPDYQNKVLIVMENEGFTQEFPLEKCFATVTQMSTRMSMLCHGGSPDRTLPSKEIPRLRKYLYGQDL